MPWAVIFKAFSLERHLLFEQKDGVLMPGFSLLYRSPSGCYLLVLPLPRAMLL
jgi:hypothetical protein